MAKEAIRKASDGRVELRTPIRFQGQYYDHETGLHYNRYRYYDPEVGRYVNKDPIGYVGGLNTFQYVPSPTSQIDALGLCSSKLNRRLGGTPHDGRQAHHLIPEEIWKNNQGFFDKLEMDMDDAANGLLMPDSEANAKKMKAKIYHCGSHTVYSTAVGAQVHRIKTALQEGGISIDEARSRIGKLQHETRLAITAGMVIHGPTGRLM